MKVAPAVGEAKRKVATPATASTWWAPSLTSGVGGAAAGAGAAVGAAGGSPLKTGHECGGTFSCSERSKEPMKLPFQLSSGCSTGEPSTAIRYSRPPVTGAWSIETGPGEEAIGTSPSGPDPS